jgi:hypothetical protein
MTWSGCWADWGNRSRWSSNCLRDSRSSQSDDDPRAALRTAPGVLGVGEPGLPDDVRELLTETEQVFVDAWLLGRRPKTRPVEGLAWDAPGFERPDLPR